MQTFIAAGDFKARCLKLLDDVASEYEKCVPKKTDTIKTISTNSLSTLRIETYVHDDYRC
jgi:hypothetical protein